MYRLRNFNQTGDEMALTRTTVSLTYDKTGKTVTCENIPAIRETEIAVTIVNGAELYAYDPVLKIQVEGNNGNTTPIGNLSSWTDPGESDDLSGTLNLNTTEAIAEFADAGNREIKTFNVLLILTTDADDLEFNGIIRIMNNPSANDTAPVTLDQSAELADCVKYSDFTDVTDLSSSSSIGQNRAKINEILAILRGD